MKRATLLTLCLLSASFFLFSCGGKDKAKDESGKKETIRATDDGTVPAIDTANLKDEASILAAMQLVVDARLADERKQKEDPKYAGHYVELTTLYAAVLRASTAYSLTLSDPNKAMEFDKKVTDIQNKMYEK